VRDQHRKTPPPRHKPLQNRNGSDGTRTRDLRRDRFVPGKRRLATIDAQSLYSCASAGLGHVNCARCVTRLRAFAALLLPEGLRLSRPLRSCDDRLFAGMSAIILRGGVELEHPLELALDFLAAYSSYEAFDSTGPASFDESDLRLANRGVPASRRPRSQRFSNAVVRSKAPCARSAVMHRWRTRRVRSRGFR
jgi:hypothetical protein